MARALCLLVVTAAPLPLLFLASPPACAEVVETYHALGPFLSALPGTPGNVEFEDLGPDVLLPNGSEVGGVVLASSAPGEEMKTVACYEQTTPSGTTMLGLPSRDEAFLSGDILSFEFPVPSLAFGVYVIGSPGDIRPGDLALETPFATVFNEEPEIVMPDGGEAFFLGLIITDPDVGSVLTHVTLRSHDPDGAGYFIFNIDDLLFTVPGGEADLLVTKLGPPHVARGGIVSYEILIDNLGPDNAYAVEVHDPTPPGFLFLQNSGHLIKPFPGTVSIIPAGKTLAVQSVYAVPSDYAETVFATNTVWALSPTPDPGPGAGFAHAVTVVDPDGDRDEDHLSNADERIAGTHPERPDTDEDGMLDGHEVIADTDPVNSNSVLMVTAIVQTGEVTQVTWQGGVWATQLLEWRTEPGAPVPWNALLTNYPPTPVDVSAEDPNPADRLRHYRIRIMP